MRCTTVIKLNGKYSIFVQGKPVSVYAKYNGLERGFENDGLLQYLINEVNKLNSSNKENTDE